MRGMSPYLILGVRYPEFGHTPSSMALLKGLNKQILGLLDEILDHARGHKVGRLQPRVAVGLGPLPASSLVKLFQDLCESSMVEDLVVLDHLQTPVELIERSLDPGPCHLVVQVLP